MPIEVDYSKVIENRVTNGLGYKGASLSSASRDLDGDIRLRLNLAELDWQTGQASPEEYTKFRDVVRRLYAGLVVRLSLEELQCAVERLAHPSPVKTKIPLSKWIIFPKLQQATASRFEY